MTKCYTYELIIKVQVLAETEELANAALDEKGGYLSERTVKLLTITELGYPVDESVEVIHSIDNDK